MSSLPINYSAFQPSSRRGFTLLEVGVAGALLFIVMAFTVPMLNLALGKRRESEQRQWALQEAVKVMERLTMQPWEQLAPENLAAIELPPETRDVLPEGQLAAQVTSDPNEANAKRLVVQVRWQRRIGQPDASVRLTSWVYRRGGTEQ